MTELLVSLLHFYEKGLLEFKNVLEILALAEAKKNVVRLILKDEHAGQVSKTICAALPEITCKPSKFGLRTSFATSDWDFFQERVTDGNHEERAFFTALKRPPKPQKRLRTMAPALWHWGDHWASQIAAVRAMPKSPMRQASGCRPT